MKRASWYTDFNGGTWLQCPYCNRGIEPYPFVSVDKFKCPHCNRKMREPLYKPDNSGKKLNKGHCRFSLFNLYIKLRRYILRRNYENNQSS